MIRRIELPLKYLNGIYAILVTTDDHLYNEDICELQIIDNKEDYEIYQKEIEILQPHTGMTGRVLYKKAEK